MGKNKAKQFKQLTSTVRCRRLWQAFDTQFKDIQQFFGLFFKKKPAIN